MATIQTKYGIGDTVFLASTTTTRMQHPCPDCKGTRRWEATSPAGGNYSFQCPRCSTSYRSNQDMSLEYSSSIPLVSKLTIGSVRHDSAERDGRCPTTYMCRETGVGSGSVYEESRLFETKEAAMAAATVMAAEANQKTQWIVKQYNASLEISDYQLDSAALKLATDTRLKARSMLYNLDDLFAKIDDASGKDEIIEAVEEYKKYDWARDKAKADEARS